MEKSKFWQIAFIWTLMFWLYLNFMKPGQTVLTPDQQAAVNSAASPTGKALTGDPAELTNPDLTVRIAPDGSLITAKVHRYDEEILQRQFVPEEIFKHWTERQMQGSPPTYSAGLFVAQPPTFITDERRMHLTAVTEKVPDGVKVTTSDPEGRLLPKGLAVERHYSLRPKGYLLDLTVTLKNTTGDLLDLSKQPAVQMFAGPMFVEGRYPPEMFVNENNAVRAVSGSATPTELTTGVKYIGIRSPYYAMVLDRVKGPGSFVYQSLAYRDLKGKSATGPIVGFKTNVPFIKKGESETFAFRLYLGLKLEGDLGPDYAGVYNNFSQWYGGISKLMFHVLQFFYSITGSYGFAILLLTFLVKLMLHPMSSGMLENQQRMAAIQPRIQEIKERYKDNPEQLNAETMKLWQEHNYNPVAGCLPMFLQIPIFIALYSCLQQSIELKGVGFWWMPDLSKPDPTTMLALLFALSVYLNGKLMQQRQSTQASAAPAGGDQDMQVVMNRMMPIMMYGMFVMMPVPGGVMIYLASQSLLGIVETRYNMYKQKNKPAKRPKASA